MNIWSDTMILLAMSNSELILIILIALVVITLAGMAFLNYAKKKVEAEIDEIESETKEETVEKTTPTKPISPVPKNEVETVDTIPEIENLVENSTQEKVEDNKTKESISEIELLLEQMQSDLKKHEQDPIHTFEEEQEEKSIISYQELKAMKEKQDHAKEIEHYEQEQEAYSITHKPEVERIVSPRVPEEPKPIPVESKLPKEEPKEKSTYSRTEFISPVYGKMEPRELDYPKIPNFKEEFQLHHNEKELQFDDVKVNLKTDEVPDLEHTFDLGPLSDETKKNDEFLKALKEFRNNLE